MSPLDLLTIVFVVLKLLGIIGWSWWWVTAPTWGGLIIAILGFVGFTAFAKRGFF